MVGLFSGYNNNMDKKEDHQAGREKDEENERKNLLHFVVVVDDDDDDDGDGEFRPIERPLQPPEDDRPANCPAMPDLSFVYDDSAKKEPFTKNHQTRAVSFVAKEVDPSKHHKHAQDSANPIQLRGQQYNIFEAFNQCNEFGFS